MDLWDFCDIEWGKDEAKGDDELLDYFVPIPEFESIKNGNIRYVIGRKGAGKTAIVERLRLEAESDPKRFHSTLTLRDFPLNDVRNLRDKSYRDKSQFVPVWLFLIYVELAKLAISDHGVFPKDSVHNLEDFLKINNLANAVGFVDTISLLKSTGSKVKVLAHWLEGSYEKNRSSQTEIQVHYHKVVNLLKEFLGLIKTDSQYWIFIDELDEGYRAGDANLRLLLLALLRAVEDSQLAMRRTSINYRPLLVLRSDIFDRLEDNDLNKLDDYLIRLHWNSREDDSKYALKSIPNARIRTSLKNIKASDPWSMVVLNEDPNLPTNVNTMWQYMVNRTYERPRDIIKFLKYCKRTNTRGRLTFHELRSAEDQYSAWLYNELRDEIHSYLPVWREALQCLSRIGKGKIKYKDYIDELNNDRTIKKWLSDNGKDPEEIIETLFDFSIIGNLDKGRWLFKYKDNDLTWNPSMHLIVHYGLNRKLRLFKR